METLGAIEPHAELLADYGPDFRSKWPEHPSGPVNTTVWCKLNCLAECTGGALGGACRLGPYKLSVGEDSGPGLWAGCLLPPGGWRRARERPQARRGCHVVILDTRSPLLLCWQSSLLLC